MQLRLLHLKHVTAAQATVTSVIITSAAVACATVVSARVWVTTLKIDLA